MGNPLVRSCLWAPLAVVVACAPVDDNPPPDCTVTTPGDTQATAIVIEDTYIAFVLDDAIGGQVCVPGVAAVCETKPRCSGELDVAVGSTASFNIVVKNSTRSHISVDDVFFAFGTDPAWSFDDAANAGTNFTIYPESSERIVVRVAPQIEGAITAELIVGSDAVNVVDGATSIFLTATGVEP